MVSQPTLTKCQWSKKVLLFSGAQEMALFWDSFVWLPKYKLRTVFRPPKILEMHQIYFPTY